MKLNKKQKKLQEVVDAKAKAQMSSFVIDETGTLVKYNGSYADVYIPSSVKRIGENAFKECKTIKTVWLSYSVNTLCKNAFSNCTSLKSVYVTEGLEYIGDGAFMSCYALDFFSIDKNVCHIGDGAFAYCKSLLIAVKKGNKHFKKGKKDLAIYTKDGKTLVAYSPGSSVSEFKVPKKVTRIRSTAFGGALALTSVTLPSGLCQIEDFVLAGCARLRTVNIPSKVSRIGYAAFAYCNSLSEITLPATVQNIGYNAFLIDKSFKITYEGSKDAWEKVSKSKEFAVAGKYTLNCKKTLGSLMASMNVKASEKGIQKDKAQDEAINLLTDKYCNFWVNGAGKLIKYTGKSTKLYIPEGVTSLDYNAIPREVINKAVEIYIPSTMKEAEIYLNNPVLEKLSFAKGVEKISGEVIAPKLKELNLPETLVNMHLSMYENLIEKIYIPSKVTSITPAVYTNIGIDKFSISKKNSTYKMINGNFIDVANKKLLKLGKDVSEIPTDLGIEIIGYSSLRGRPDIKSIVFPEGVKKIDGFVFGEGTEVESITLPNTLEEFDTYALADTKIKEINIPKTVKVIDSSVFSDCNELRKVTIDPENETYVSIDNCIIEKAMKKLVYCAVGASVPTDGSVTAIGNSAFRNMCGGIINIPASVTLIEDEAFFSSSNVKAVIVDEANEDYTAIDGILYNKDTTKFLCIPDGLEGEVTIPEGISKIPKGYEKSDYLSFKERKITKVTLPEELYIIESNAFEKCSELKEINIPSTVHTIRSLAFAECGKLTDIYCARSEKPADWSSSWLDKCNATVHWKEEDEEEEETENSNEAAAALAEKEKE